MSLSVPATSSVAAPSTRPHYATWTATAVPLLVLTGFGLVTAVPVAALGIAALFDKRLRPFRSGIALTVGTFTGPFITWLFRADPTASLTSLLHPTMTVLIASVATGTMISMLRHNRA